MSGWRPFPDFSWDLRACGRHGHTTYAPDEPESVGRMIVRVTPDKVTGFAA